MTKETDEEAQTPEPLNTHEIGDRSYELYKRACPSCGKDHFEIYRWAGGSFSRYRLPHDLDRFESDDFESYCEWVDERLLVSSSEMMSELREQLSEINDRHGINADFSFEFLLAEYSRQRLSKLKKLGFVDHLLKDTKPKSKLEDGIRTAFELGMAAAEHKYIRVYEPHIYAGYDLEEWRTTGQPKATAARVRQGRQTREAVVKAAKALYRDDHLLVRNDQETSRRIRAMNLPGIVKPQGQVLSIDSIAKHLRAARKEGKL